MRGELIKMKIQKGMEKDRKVGRKIKDIWRKREEGRE